MASVTDAEWAAMRREVEAFRARLDPGAGGPPVPPTGRDGGATVAPVAPAGADRAAHPGRHRLA